jgi:hypothetical protein
MASRPKAARRPFSAGASGLSRVLVRFAIGRRRRQPTLWVAASEGWS